MSARLSSVALDFILSAVLRGFGGRAEYGSIVLRFPLPLTIPRAFQTKGEYRDNSSVLSESEGVVILTIRTTLESGLASFNQFF